MHLSQAPMNESAVCIIIQYWIATRLCHYSAGLEIFEESELLENSLLLVTQDPHFAPRISL